MKGSTMKRLLALMGLGGLVAAGIATAAPSDASPLSYLQSLNTHGIWVYDTAAALTTGYQICDALNYNTGDVVAYNVFSNTSWYDVPNVDTAATWVLVSVEELCPWHDHRDVAMGPVVAR